MPNHNAWSGVRKSKLSTLSLQGDCTDQKPARSAGVQA